MPIYVEIEVGSDVEDVWRATQVPEIHERWDLRFTSIEYLPKEDGEPQRFLYSTRLGFGMKIDGTGESIAERSTGGQSTSSLKFWSDDPKSLILEGSGYWQYTQLAGRTKFVTGYDYKTRYGALGRLFDRLVFRPLIGWATAWSFDSMRLFVEKGIRPEESRRMAAINLLVRLTLAFVWIYQGLVPKLLYPHTGEVEIVRAANPPLLTAENWVTTIGVLEILFGLMILLLVRAAWVLKLQIAALAVLTVGAYISSPVIFIEPFNPVAINVAMIGLACIALVAMRDLPTAKRCKRKKETAEE